MMLASVNRFVVELCQVRGLSAGAASEEMAMAFNKLREAYKMSTDRDHNLTEVCTVYCCMYFESYCTYKTSAFSFEALLYIFSKKRNAFSYDIIRHLKKKHLPRVPSSSAVPNGAPVQFTPKGVDWRPGYRDVDGTIPSRIPVDGMIPRTYIHIHIHRAGLAVPVL